MLLSFYSLPVLHSHSNHLFILSHLPCSFSFTRHPPKQTEHTGTSTAQSASHVMRLYQPPCHPSTQSTTTKFYILSQQSSILFIYRNIPSHILAVYMIKVLQIKPNQI